MTKIGAEITVSQSVGSKDYRRAAHYASQAITLSTTIGFIYACIIILAAPLLMGLFRFETSISTQAIDYMRLVAPGLFSNSITIRSAVFTMVREIAGLLSVLLP